MSNEQVCAREDMPVPARIYSTEIGHRNVEGTSLCSRGHSSACKNIFDRNGTSECRRDKFVLARTCQCLQEYIRPKWDIGMSKEQVRAREVMPVPARICSTEMGHRNVEGTSLCSRGHASACKNIFDIGRSKGQVCAREDMTVPARIYSTEMGHRNVEGTSLCSRGHASACKNIFDRNGTSKGRRDKFALARICQCLQEYIRPKWDIGRSKGQVCAREDMPVPERIYSTEMGHRNVEGTSLCSRGHASACRNIFDQNGTSEGLRDK